MSIARQYLEKNDGAVSVEAALLSTLMLLLTIAAFEICYGFFQWNTAQQSARVGARIAATSQPISPLLSTMTGLESGVKPGDPLPDYDYNCDGASSSCSEGGFDDSAFDAIIYGPDNDGLCGPTDKARLGMCDIFSRVGRENVDIEYRSSGLGRAGNPATPVPLITVTLKDVEFDFAMIRYFAPRRARVMPPISVTVVAEDMRSGA